MPDSSRQTFAIADARAILQRTPRALDAQLRGLPDAWIHGNEGEATWSPFEVVAHLILADRTNWIPRARFIFEHGESRPFEEFQRYPAFARDEDWTLPGLLDEFAAVREVSVEWLSTLTPPDLERRGRHPAFGAVTLEQLLSAWVVHDLDHLVQVSRTLARQYTDAVGPWREFLRVVRDVPR